jgi:two-component sensor histidine kinase
MATADRIQVMSRLHERLKRRDTAAFVNIGSFIEDLCGDLKGALVGPRPILLKVDAQDHLLPEEQAVAVGLIVNELVTNSLKHAFPDDQMGAVGVQFGKDRDHYVLRVADDGIGCPPKADPALSSGLGQRLIRSMVAQLGGEVMVEPNGELLGTSVAVRFPAAA